MKKLNLIFLFASAAILVACDTKELTVPEGPLPARDKVPLQLTSGISSTRGITRAYDTMWEANDLIGVFTTVAGSTTITKSGSQDDANISYKISTTEQTLVGSTPEYKPFTPTDDASQIYLPADGSDVDVYAYYPWKDGVTASSPLNITIPGVSSAQTLSEQKAVDVLMAKALTDLSDSENPKPIDIDHTTAQLLFHHCLSKVLIKVMVGTGYSVDDLKDRIDVKITGQPINATFQPVGQSFAITTLPENFTDIIPYEVPKPEGVEQVPDYDPDVLYTYRAILLPNGTGNPADAEGRKIEFTVGKKEENASKITYTYDLKNDLTEPLAFNAGQVTTITLTINATGLTVDAAIKPWTTSNINPNDSLLPIDDNS